MQLIILLQALCFSIVATSAAAEENASFSVDLIIPVKLQDKPTGDFFHSAVDAKQSPILHYFRPAQLGHVAVEHLNTSTKKIFRDSGDHMGAEFEFRSHNPLIPNAKAVGLRLIAELLSPLVQTHQKHEQRALEHLEQKLKESGFDHELPKLTTGGHFVLDVLNEKGEKWSILLNPRQLRIEFTFNYDYYPNQKDDVHSTGIKLRIRAQIEPQVLGLWNNNVEHPETLSKNGGRQEKSPTEHQNTNAAHQS